MESGFHARTRKAQQRAVWRERGLTRHTMARFTTDSTNTLPGPCCRAAAPGVTLRMAPIKASSGAGSGSTTARGPPGPPNSAMATRWTDGPRPPTSGPIWLRRFTPLTISAPILPHPARRATSRLSPISAAEFCGMMPRRSISMEPRSSGMKNSRRARSIQTFRVLRRAKGNTRNLRFPFLQSSPATTQSP